MNPIFKKLSHTFLQVGLSAILVMLCVCCSKEEFESSIQTTSSVEIEEKYDSVYNATYSLYVVNDDTTAYNLLDYNSPLTSAENEVRKSLNEYAVKMLSDYSGASSANTILSPFNASMLYSLMANFTDEKKDENTFKENMGISSGNKKDINSFFRKFINKRSHSTSQDEEKTSYANTLWMNKKSAVYNSFLSRTKYYGFDVKGIDLDQASSIDAINSFVRSKIGSNDAQIKQSSVEDAKPLVTSSMSFKGEWKEKFYVDSTLTNWFTNSNGSKASCKILWSTRKGRWSRFDTFDMMEILYKDNNYSMYIILPHEDDGLSKSLSDLRNYGISRCMNMVSDTTRTYHGEYYIPRDTTTILGTFTVVDTLITDTIFDIRIPKFKLCASTELNPKNLAGNAAAKLIYQTNLPKVSPNGYSLSNVFQSCSLEINEQSTSASSTGSISEVDVKLNATNAITGISHHYIILPYKIDDKPKIPRGRKIKDTIKVPFYVAHPFAVFIRENEIGTIPFACCIKSLNF